MTSAESFSQNNINRKIIERETSLFYVKGYYYDPSLDSRSTTYAVGEFVCHNIGFPAAISKNGTRVMWFFNGSQHKHVIPYCNACGFDEETTVFWLLKYGDELPNHVDKC